MNKKTLGAGILALAIPALVLSVNAAGANAADVTSTVTAIDSCAWQVSGVPTSVAMTSADGALYKGTALDVSGTVESLILGVAGSADSDSATAGTSSECSFYNTIIAGGLTVAIGDLDFDATYEKSGPKEDDEMGFTVGTSNPLGVELLSAAQACGPVFTQTNAALETTAASTLIASSATGTNPLANVNATGSNVRCDSDLTFTLKIPETNGVPAGAGYGYTFTGPTMTFTKVG